MADGTPPRRVDAAAARARCEKALAEHEQLFERFVIARLWDLDSAYLPEDAPDAEKEVCRITFDASEMGFNPQGSLHGGVLATVMDISMGHLVNKVAGPGATVEMKIQYMRPIGAGTVTVEGAFLRRGRSMAFMESRAVDAAGKLSAHATATWKMPG
ncbi:MAG: PaaI family thioesterase [Pseudomonadota bacterium]